MSETNNENTVISPDQMSLLDNPQEETMHMEIPHLSNEAPLIGPVEHNMDADEEDVTTGTKLKILASLVIVSIAGYIAYWVQEPVQLNADVLNSMSSESTSTEVASADTVDTSATPEAATDTTESPAVTGTSVNVDVSLFGFEPATLKIDKGTTVIWTNTSTEDQTIIGSAENGQSFASPVLTSGQTFSFKFEEDAVFEYYSTYNPALKASVTVGLGNNTDAVATTTETSTTAVVSETETVASADTSQVTTTAEEVLSDVVDSKSNTTVETTAEESVQTTAIEELKPSAPQKLSKTGPAEDLYAVMILGIAWLNRKKLQKAFQK